MENTVTPLIDIGVNLTNASFKDDLDEVITRAFDAGIEQMIVTGTEAASSEAAQQLAANYSGQLFSTAGIHPHDAKTLSADTIDTIKSLTELTEVVAVGETGLDFNRNYSPPEDQIRSFEQHIELAIDTGLPMFLHERDAFNKQWEILKHYRDQLSDAVIHCFTGEKQQAFRYLDLDLYIGITGWICDERRGAHLHDFVNDIPIDRLLIETDAPYLMPRVKPAPKLKSKRRNEPCTLPLVLNTIAEHHSLTASQLAWHTTDNARRLFRLPVPTKAG